MTSFLKHFSHGIAGDKILCPRGSKVLPLLKTSYDVLEIEHFVKSLSKNKTLIGRPKILIFDCCRGDEVNVGELKSFGKGSLPHAFSIFNACDCIYKEIKLA